MSDNVSLAAPKRRAWIMASRPRTLPAAIAPVVVGTALAVHDGAFRPPAALVALVAALLIQIGSNFANDLGDYLRGTDARERVGPLRVTTAGLLSPREVQTGMIVVFGLAAVCGLYLISLGGWPILLIGILSIAAAIAYTAGPLPFGYYGLGDLGVFVFFGLAAVCGTYYVQAHTLTPAVWLVAVAMGCLVTAILVVNNVRDADTDSAAGKRTLAVLLGRRGARIEYLILLAIAYVVPLILWLVLGYRPGVLLAWLTLPLAYRHTRAVFTVLGPALNKTLAGTAQLAVAYALAFTVGVMMWG
ncbi:MAG: 1,4-dihydroxy-2-naphthoate polyprenyltransferase [Anaerolineae bacterium]|nr:1,4-dihydroxy-2-naphthoate polyprenyltransferase [Anaerolineae bacterium]